MVKINETYNVNKKGVVRRNPSSHIVSLQLLTPVQVYDMININNDIQKSKDYHREQYNVKVTESNIRDAIIYNIKHRLRYNRKTGKTLRDGDGELSSYTKKSDIAKYNNFEEAVYWEMRGIILNDAQRLANGYKI